MALFTLHSKIHQHFKPNTALCRSAPFVALGDQRMTLARSSMLDSASRDQITILEFMVELILPVYLAFRQRQVNERLAKDIHPIPAKAQHIVT